MSARDAILGKVRAALAAGDELARKRVVADRMKTAAPGIIPARAKLDPKARATLFSTMAEGLFATVERLKKKDDVPKAVAAYLRGRNLPASLRMGSDPRLAALPWGKQRALEVKSGPSDGDDLAGVSHGFAGIAETGTLVMVSGSENPSTVNFLPDHHIVVLDAADVEGDMEAAIARVRRAYGKGSMPRTVNFISGPSRSGDIEQKLILGAHGPRALHIILVG